MKNKTLTYALLIVVGVIWYNVFFRVKDNIFGENAVSEESSQPINRNIPLISKDTFELKVNYSDPFGAANANWSKLKPVNIEGGTPKNRVVREKPKMTWPKIKYFGLVKKTSSSSPLGILNIDGYQFTLRSGDSPYDGITVKRIWRDSVEMKCGKETRIFQR